VPERYNLKNGHSLAESARFPLLPYCYVIGQEELQNVLEVAYVMGTERSGVLVSGERGTAKSTIARSFAYMMYGALPVNLPINATDDRVIGGWDINSLMKGDRKPIWKPGLLRQADQKMLYIDEVNLLEDHIINLILDPVSTGVLNPQRDGRDGEADPAETGPDVRDTTVEVRHDGGNTTTVDLKPDGEDGAAEADDGAAGTKDVSFMLVGTMNPDEGPLRPQLLDRFAFYVYIESMGTHEARKQILTNVLRFDLERRQPDSEWLRAGTQRDQERKNQLEQAKRLFEGSSHDDEAIIDVCARVAAKFNVVGHRAEIVMARAAYAFAARDFMIKGKRPTPKPTSADVAQIAKYAIVHRRPDAVNASVFGWDEAADRVKLNSAIVEVVGSEPR
jgi:magnesium chelatase subunit I